MIKKERRRRYNKAMKQNDITSVLDFENSIKVGDIVEVRWTNSFYLNSGPAKITKINSKSFRIALTETVKSKWGNYPIGQEFPVPRFLGTGWSDNNRVFPLG